MKKQEKQNSMVLHRRLAIGFGMVNIIVLLISAISFITVYALYTEGSITSDKLTYFSGAIALLIILSLIISIVACKILNRSMVRPLKILNNIARQLSAGDTSANVRVLTNDEVGKLMQSFKTMLENMRRQAQIADAIAGGDLTVQIEVNSDKDTLGIALNSILEKNNIILSRICSTSNEIANGAGQISEASVRLAEGSIHQTASLEELAASISDVKSRIDSSAEDASLARTCANDVTHDAADGNNRMGEMLKAMDEINISSVNISKVMKAIEDIAFQTNILSLNASVEAARAGQHGKGFAVVADEVRSLAERSAKAAKETADMVKNSIQSVERGAMIAKTTADAFSKIVNGIGQVSALTGKIADTSTEQALCITTINEEIKQISVVVQANSAASEESTAATAHLYEQAEALKEMVQTFQLKAPC